MNPLSVHGIPVHIGGIGGRTDAEWLNGLDPAFVKVVTNDETVPHIDLWPKGAKLIIRNYPLSELGHDRGFSALRELDTFLGQHVTPQNGSGRDLYRGGPGAFYEALAGLAATRGANSIPEEVGKQHAETCNRIAAWCESRGVPRSRLLFEGLNEPMLWSVEPPAQVARYYRQFLITLHSFNLRGVVGNFGVGWPGNGGVQDAPVDWEPFKPMIDAMLIDPKLEACDYLGLHEYWNMSGPGENWKWWAGRFLQSPFNVPILITETNIDTGVAGNPGGGWQNLPGSMTERARRDIQELAWYWAKCREDGRVRAIFPFTYDRATGTWEAFDVRVEDWLKEAIAKRSEFPEPKPFAWTASPFPDTTPPPPPPTPPPATDKVLAALMQTFGAGYVDLRNKLPKHKTVRWPTRASSFVTSVVVHHDAGGPPPSGIPALTARAVKIAEQHIASPRFYETAAYHFYIGPDGTLLQLNGLDKVTWHAGSVNHNYAGVGICFAGNFENYEPTEAALATYRRLYALLRAFLPKLEKAVGHRDVSQTACPGKHLYAALFQQQREPLPRDEPVPLKTKVTFWVEEAQRMVEQGRYDRAQLILEDLVPYIGLL